MKLRLSAFPVLVLSTGLLLFSGCTKSISEESSPSLTSGYSKSIPEIGLKINFDFQRTNPDAFKATVSDGFSIEQVNSLYNSDQQIEYFTIRCKKSGGETFLLSGTVDAKNNVIISFAKKASITF